MDSIKDQNSYICISSITITNTNIAILIFDAIQNKWQVISNGSSSGGDNLGNHTATTDLKLENNKIYFNTGLTKYIQNDNSLGINYVTPSSTSHWFHIGGVGSYTFGITTGGVSTQVPILMNNHYLEGVDYIDFNSSGSIQKIDTSADGKVFNFYTNNTQRLNISENSLLNGTLELYGAGGTGSQASASFKTVSTQTATTNLYIGDFVFDGKNNLGVQKTYADIIAQSVDTTSGSEDGAILFNVITAGTLSNRLTLNSSGLANAGTFSSLGYVTFYGGGYLGGTFSADIITGIDYLTFGVTSGNSPKIDVSTNGKVINFYTNTQTTSRVNISENTLLNGTLELYGAGGTVGQASASFKTVSTQTAATNLYIGDFVFDGKNSSGVQTTYADIIAQSATTTAGAENGAILFNIKTAGTLTNRLTLNSSGLTNAGTFSSIGSATFSSYLIAAGGLRASVFTVASGTYAVDPTDVTVVSTNTSGTVTLNLPSASTNAGAFYIFYKRNAGGSTVINRAGSDLIDGATSYSLINQFQTVLMQSDGAAKWMVLSSG